MANPFYQPNTNINTNQLRDIYRAFSSSKNPIELFTKMAQNNPSLKPILNMLQAGNNPQMVFNQLCQQRGINPQDFIKSITG